jgi:hypothetical protein
VKTEKEKYSLLVFSTDEENRRKRRKINKRERSARSIWALPGGGKIG